MKRQRSVAAADTPSSELTRLIRRSRLLDPIAKRHWLELLPYLTPSDRARLEDILNAETSAPRQ